MAKSQETVKSMPWKKNTEELNFYVCVEMLNKKTKRIKHRQLEEAPIKKTKARYYTVILPGKFCLVHSLKDVDKENSRECF